MEKEKKNNFFILKGTAAEIISAVVSYPLSTLKTNKQVGNQISKQVSNQISNQIGKQVGKQNILKPLLSLGKYYKGLHYCILNEILNGIFFYSTYSLVNSNTLIKTACATVVSKSVSHPVFLRRKLVQVGLNDTIKGFKNNYKGFGISLINSIPVNVINFGLKDYIILPDKLKTFSGLLSTFLAIIITHPLDTFGTSIMCSNKLNCNLFSGFTERLVERTLTVGSKMMLIDNL